jgi:hypothetical protein
MEPDDLMTMRLKRMVITRTRRLSEQPFISSLSFQLRLLHVNIYTSYAYYLYFGTHSSTPGAVKITMSRDLPS